MLGYRVDGADSVLDGLVHKIVPSGAYAVVQANGEMPNAIVQTWQEVWRSGLRRAYTGDFEVYTSPSSAAIYVALAD